MIDDLINLQATLSHLGALLQRFHIVYIGSAIILTFLSWWHYERSTAPSIKSFVGFCFPREHWLSDSALLDYRYVAFDRIAIAVLGGIAALWIDKSFDESPYSGFWYIPADPNVGVVILYTACLLISEDFFRYWAHRIMHMSPILWEFHKVHHSSRTLTPITLMREHPMNGIINLLRSAIGVGVVTGLFYLIWPDQITPVTVLGVNAGRFLFNVMGANLRHSHVWISFGPVASRFFISPAMHQIHHSNNPIHYDRNFGSQFAIWDWMFNTLYIPKTRETLSYGLTSDEDTGQYNSIWALYSVPFRQVVHLMRTMPRHVYLRFRLLESAAENKSQPDSADTQILCGRSTSACL